MRWVGQFRYRGVFECRRIAAAVFISLLLASLSGSLRPIAVSQTTAEQSERRKTSTPYKGDLGIFESPDRDKKLQVERVMDILGIREGTSVGDIGAGSGWFSLRAAKRVGDRGSVYAVDINPDAIQYIKDHLRREGINNVRTVLSSEDDPRLPANSIDSVLILKTYHEISDPVRLLENLRRSLRNGARVGIIDRNGSGEDHGVQQEVVEREAARAGYRLVEHYDFVKADREDYFLVFQLKGEHP